MIIQKQHSTCKVHSNKHLNKVKSLLCKLLKNEDDHIKEIRIINIKIKNVFLYENSEISLLN
jgi:hypothetical protein